ncbi:MAG: BON domain-containing protein [Pseudobdellovibrionaceae bacterium]|nr:BON domain-containing protein [Bdellovibrionales bacterium]USN46947.1 MAG: BON domain-containing protein [Pseudobdellovibrionaceae bacterium]
MTNWMSKNYFTLDARRGPLLALLAVLSLVFLFGPATISEAAQRKKMYVSLFVGIDRDIRVPLAPAGFNKGGSYKNLLKLQFDSNRKILRLVPQKIGVGTILIKDPTTGAVIYDIRVDVKKVDLQKVAREVRALLAEIEGVKIKIANNRVIVDGEVLLPKDMDRIHSVVKQYGDLAASLVTLSVIAQNKIAQFIERKIGNPEITVSAVNGRFLLEGMANSPEEVERAFKIARTYMPDVVVRQAEMDKLIKQVSGELIVNLIQVKPAPEQTPNKIIQIVVHYVELKKDYTKGFRFQWTPDIGDNTQLEFTDRGPGGVVSSITGTISNLLPKLNWAKEHGHARVLQSSSLIVEDGKQGKLESVQRIPYQTVTSEGQNSTSFEDAGIRTTVTPSIIGSRSDSVSLALNFSVKSLVGITNKGPLTNSREIQTSVVVRSGMSAAVGGLISNESGTDFNRLPENTSANPLFSLYASKSFRRNQSQFVVFVTPIIKSSASAGADRIKRKFRIRD